MRRRCRAFARPVRVLSAPGFRGWIAEHARHASAAHNSRMDLLKTFGLFVATALAEIVGCYLPYLWLRQDRSPWLLVPAAVSLALFAWLLSLHPTAAGRVYAAYGGVYIGVAILWLWLVDKVQPTVTDWVGVGVSLLGMLIIMSGQRVVR